MEVFKINVFSLLVMLMVTNAFGLVEDRTFDSEVISSHTKDGFSLSILDEKTEQEIVAKVSKAVGLTEDQVSSVFPAIVNSLVHETLKGGGTLSLIGFGSFSVSSSSSFWNGVDIPPGITVGDELPSGLTLSFTLDPEVTNISIGTSSDILELIGMGVPSSLVSSILKEDEILASKIAETIAFTIAHIGAAGLVKEMTGLGLNEGGVVFILDSGMAGDNAHFSDSCSFDLYDAIDGLKAGPNYDILGWSDASGHFDFISEGKGEIKINKVQKDYDCLVYPADVTKYIGETEKNNSAWPGNYFPTLTK
ncbi:MAG: hypothetical protein HOE90_04730 [Bacteriovoracaceae bacterium]|jgi:hypothetical protein|nr:hypothetical protein [Bacteriovoracaceae bacterium]